MNFHILDNEVVTPLSQDWCYKAFLIEIEARNCYLFFVADAKLEV